MQWGDAEAEFYTGFQTSNSFYVNSSKPRNGDVSRDEREMEFVYITSFNLPNSSAILSSPLLQMGKGDSRDWSGMPRSPNAGKCRQHHGCASAELSGKHLLRFIMPHYHASADFSSHLAWGLTMLARLFACTTPSDLVRYVNKTAWNNS